MIRIHHCLARVILRQSWLFDDPQQLAEALTRLVTDVLVTRMSTRVESLSHPAQLGVVALRVVLPASVVLELADTGISVSEGRNLAPFSAEVAVSNAASDALHAAFEQAVFQSSEWQGTWDSSSQAGSDRPQSGSYAAQLVEDTGGFVAILAEQDRAIVGPLSIAEERLIAAVSATLLAAARQGRLRPLMRRVHPAMAAEWLRLLGSAWRLESPKISNTVGWSAQSGAGDTSGPGVNLVPARGEGPDRLAAEERLPGSAARMPPSPVEGVADQAEFDDRGHEAAGDGAQIAVFPADWESPGRRVIGVPPTMSDAEEGSADRRPTSQEFPAMLAPGVPPTPAEVESVARTVLRTYGTTEPASIRLEAAAAVAAALQLSLDDPQIWQALEPLLAHANTAATDDIRTDGPTEEMPAGAREVKEAEAIPPRPHSSVQSASSHPTPMPGTAVPVLRSEVQVASVLPFLLVGPLNDLGVLDAITAAVAGLGAPDLIRAFAAGLARKVLPPPYDGWRQPLEVTATVAAFAGQQNVPHGSAIERLGRSVDQWWPVVEEVLIAELVDLRAASSPLLVTHSAGGFVAAGADGLAPLLWGGTDDAVRRLWERCDRPTVFADFSLAAPLSAVRPRGDSTQLESLAELVALAAERPAGGRAELAPEFDGPISLVANVGLAALAWELWKTDGELTHPALALKRLGDLDGRVIFTPDCVTARMPLGRRHADLRDSGLLRTVADVPWFDGRPMEFEAG
jgi:hypothetical protein